MCGLAGIGLLTWIVLNGCTRQYGGMGNTTGIAEEVAADSSGQPVINFDTLAHNFGTMLEGEKVLCYFDYMNTGGEPLLIQSVEASCGCTIVDWSKDPLLPGERGRMQVAFDATGRSGLQLKVVTVKSNASNGRVELMLRADVKANV